MDDIVSTITEIGLAMSVVITCCLMGAWFISICLQ